MVYLMQASEKYDKTIIESFFGVLRVRVAVCSDVNPSDAVVDQCAAVSAAPFCQPNYTDEWIQSQLFTDYSQTNYPTTMVAAAPLTNYNVSGTAACGQILWAHSGALTNCGIFVSSSTFGGCGRMDVDEASGLVACADQDNQSEPATSGTSLYKRTMVIPFAGALFSPAVSLSAGIYATAGVTVCSQTPCPVP